MSLHDRAVAYLDHHNVVTLATGGPEGLWAAAVFYVSDDTTLYFISSAQTRHARNIMALPAVAATIQEDHRNWTEIRGIQLEGSVRPLEGEERQAAIEMYGAKFPSIRDPAEPEIQQAMSKVTWFRLLPRRLYFIDNSHGLGHRDEVPLK